MTSSHYIHLALLLASYALGPVDFEDDTENQLQTP